SIESWNSPGPLAQVGLPLAQEDGDELVHPRIGEQQIRRVGHETRRGHDGVPLRLEEVEKRLADFATGHSLESLNCRMAPTGAPNIQSAQSIRGNRSARRVEVSTRCPGLTKSRRSAAFVM